MLRRMARLAPRPSRRVGSRATDPSFGDCGNHAPVQRPSPRPSRPIPRLASRDQNWRPPTRAAVAKGGANHRRRRRPARRRSNDALFTTVSRLAPTLSRVGEGTARRGGANASAPRRVRRARVRQVPSRALPRVAAADVDQRGGSSRRGLYGNCSQKLAATRDAVVRREASRRGAGDVAEVARGCRGGTQEEFDPRARRGDAHAARGDWSQARMLRRMARRRGSSGGLARKVGRGGGEAHASKDAGRVQRVARRRRLRRPRVRHLAFAGEGGTRATGFPRRFGLVSGLAPGDIGGGFLAVLRGVDGASGATFREGLGVAKAPARRAHVVRDRGRGRRAPGAAQGSRRRRRRSSPQLEPQDHGSSVRRAPRRRRETSRYGRYGRRDAREMRRGGWMARATREARGVLGAGSSGGARRAVSRCARRRRSATARRVG